MQVHDLGRLRRFADLLGRLGRGCFGYGSQRFPLSRALWWSHDSRGLIDR